MIKKTVICQQICKKIGLKRTVQHRPTLDKRELLHVNSVLDFINQDEVKNAEKTSR